MQFINSFVLAFSLLVALVSAGGGSVTFVNQDSTQRTIVFTPQEGMDGISSLVVPGDGTVSQSFPTGWIGNFYSVSEGASNVPGMLGEVAFDGFAGSTFFDVSAIVNPDDTAGVKELFPKNSNLPMSGCQTFPCANAYNKWDDVETISTDESELVCLIGNLSSQRRRGTVAKHRRAFVTGEHNEQ